MAAVATKNFEKTFRFNHLNAPTAATVRGLLEKYFEDFAKFDFSQESDGKLMAKIILVTIGAEMRYGYLNVAITTNTEAGEVVISAGDPARIMIGHVLGFACEIQDLPGSHLLS